MELERKPNIFHILFQLYWVQNHQLRILTTRSRILLTPSTTMSIFSSLSQCWMLVFIPSLTSNVDNLQYENSDRF